MPEEYEGLKRYEELVQEYAWRLFSGGLPIDLAGVFFGSGSRAVDLERGKPVWKR